MKIITSKEEKEEHCEQERKQLICPANSADFKPRRLIIPSIVVTPSETVEVETLVS